MTTISDLFPEKGKLILSGSGKALIERLGIEAARQVVLGVMRGENIRTQTEPLTRRRVAIATGAMVALFARGWNDIEDFTTVLSGMALSQMNASTHKNKEAIWPAQWLIGLTNKGIQNVLRSNADGQKQYVEDFEAAVEDAALRCEADFGTLNMSLGVIQSNGRVAKILDWKDITRLTTAIGSATLTIRGSEKSTYGKLFERLVLGSVLTILGFEYINDPAIPKMDKVFWLSDSSDDRECDATVRLRAGKLARFDIGFIGKGNPEIMKDKLTRYANEVSRYGKTSTSQTFIVVDKMPDTTKTRALAKKTSSFIVQMSMQYWPQILARQLKLGIGYESEILQIHEGHLDAYLAEKIAPIPILDFLNNVDISEESNGEVTTIDHE